MESLDGRCPGLHPYSAVTFVAVNGVKPPFPLCLQLAYSKSGGCIDDSLVPGPALSQDAAWEATKRRDGAAAAGRTPAHLLTHDLCLGRAGHQGQSAPVLLQRLQAGTEQPAFDCL